MDAHNPSKLPSEVKKASLAPIDAYQQHRSLLPSHFNEYLRVANLQTSFVRRVLDVGCGPGLHIPHFVVAMPNECTLVLLEPDAHRALVALERAISVPIHTQLLQASLDDITFTKAFDFVWMSEVAHLLGDPATWAGTVANLTATNGTVVIRTSTHEQLHSREWYKQFPEALQIDIERHPSQQAIVDAFSPLGFQVDRYDVNESKLVSKETYRRYFTEKCFSTLTSLSHDSYTEGLRRIDDSLATGASMVQWDYRMSAYVISRGYQYI